MRRLKIASLLVLASCASPIARPPGLRAVPRELGAVTWAVSPADVIGDRQIGTPVVWVAESMKRQYAATPHYILVAGTVDSIVDRAGVPTVFLYTWEFELSRDLVSRVQ